MEDTEDVLPENNFDEDLFEETMAAYEEDEAELE